MHRLAKSVYSLLFFLSFSSGVIAQQNNLTTHTIQLNYRQAEDVISLLRPFLHPEGTMAGEGYKILLKTTDRNYKDLLQLVAEVDVSLRQLRISVTVDSELAMLENRSVTGAPAPSGKDEPLANPTSKQYTQGRRNKSPATQQVQVLEGKWARISTGESVPVGQRIHNPDGTITESISYQSVKNSLQVLPRVSGEQVTLFIRPQRESSASGDRFKTGRTETTVTGKLKQWILIGGAPEAVIPQPGSRVYSTGKRTESHNQLFVKVEVVQ